MSDTTISQSLVTTVRGLERIVQVGVWFNGVLLVGVAFLIGFDVLSRKLLNFSLGGAHEIGGYFLAISSAWAASFTLFKRSHIRMDVAYSRLPERGRYVLDVLSLVALLAFVALVTWYANAMFLKSFSLGARANTPLLTPLWIPQGLWLLGLVVFLITTLAAIVTTVSAMMGLKLPELEHFIGVASTDEEVQAELSESKSRAQDLNQSKD